MNIFVFGIGAFGFAILKHIGENDQMVGLYACENDEFTFNFLKKFRRHPYFFDGVKLSEKIIFTQHYKEILPSIDVVILAVPSQRILGLVEDFKSHLKPGVIILNLAKGIDNTTLTPLCDGIVEKLQGLKYHYAVLAGGMIAAELVEDAPLGADIGIDNLEAGKKLKKIFAHHNLRINVIKGQIKNVELSGALKNVCALIIGYYEGKGYKFSTLGLYFCDLIKEIRKIVQMLGGDGKKLEFENYSFGGDMIASCFGESRNRYLGKLIGSGKTPTEALEILRSEKKRAEGYETLKGLEKILEPHKQEFPMIWECIQIMFNNKEIGTK